MIDASYSFAIPWELIGVGLFHFTWVAAVVAVVISILLHLFRDASAHVRYVLCYAALMLVLAAPCAMVLFDLSGSAEGIVDAVVVQPTPTRVKDISWNGEYIGTQFRQQERPLSDVGNVVRRALPFATTLWFIGVLMSSLYHLIGAAGIRRMSRKGREFDDPMWIQRVQELGSLVGVHQSVRIVTVAKAMSPAVIGCVKPVLLLPLSFFNGMDATYVEAILLHELAHIRRFDYLFNLLQVTVEIVGFFHPAVWWLSRRIRNEREHCCDDIAAEATGDRLVYAKSQVYLEERHFSPAFLVSAAGGDLFQRVARILGHRAHASSLGSAGGLIVASLSILLLTAFAWKTGGNGFPENPDESNAIVQRLSSQLIAYYPFDGNANDESGLQQNGVVKGSVLTEDAKGRPAHAYDFNGKDNLIWMRSGPALNASSSITVSCWMYPRRCCKYESWISKPNGKNKKSVWRTGFGEAANTEWGFTEWRPNTAMGIWNDYWLENGELPLNHWSFVAAVADHENRRVRLFVDGRKVAEIGGLVPSENFDGPVLVGFQGDDNVYFDGKVDEIRIYNAPLTDREVAALYSMN